MRGFECTIGVRDADAIAKLIVKHGGRIVSPPFQIQNVGTVVKFEDTEGNSVSAMQYAAAAFDSLGGGR